MYYIYHIPSVKIGTSINPEIRVKRQKHTKYEILEIHSDIDVASKRELQLQKEYGYEQDTVKYSHTIEMRKLGYKKGLENSHKNNSKPVIAFNYLTNEIVGEYPSLWNACKVLNINQGAATSNIKGRKKQISGYYFEYKNKI